MKILFTGAENENAFRAYPFMDDASLKASSGYVLANSAIIDANIIAVDDGDGVYMSEITDTGQIVFCRVSDGLEIGRGNLEEGLVPLYNNNLAPVGAVLTGVGWQLLKEVVPLRFTPRAATLAPSCLVPISKEVLIAVLPENGTPVAGNVRLVAAPNTGTRVVVDPVTNTARIDFLGTTTAVDPCKGYSYIRKLCFEVWEGSKFNAADNDGAGTVALTYNGKTLTEVDQDTNFGKLPDADGNLPGSEAYEALANQATVDVVASIASSRRLLHSFEVDVATGNGSVTLVSFAAAGEDPSRLLIKGRGGDRIELSLIGA